MKVLVVAVHPDDESLGCGGTILKHKKSGDEIHWLILTKSYNEEFNKKRNVEIENVSKMYNFDSVHKLDWITTKLDEMKFGDMVSGISEVFKKVEPEVVYLPFSNDVHTDHQVAFKAAYSCTKNFRYPSIRKIYMMETLSETEFTPSNEKNFIPNTFVDVSEYMDKKIEILNIYESEILEPPFPRSEKIIRALGSYRGSTCGVNYAESFMLLKEIIK